MTTAYAWAPITKVEDQDDGTVMVYGPATDAGVDRDKQRLNQDWLDRAMPTWMAEGGNVREQHDPKRAVGVGVGLTRADSGEHNLAARVVDPVAVTKVRAGVLKGFSVGIKDPQIAFGKADAPNGEVVGGSIIEVSLVDRPSNPRTMFAMVKADAAGALEDVADAEVEETDPEEGEDERVATGEQLLAEMKTLVPDLTKADAPGDIAEAMTAVACIGRLIASEATSLGAGEFRDADQISCLLDAVRALKYFISCEQRESTTPGAAEVADSMSVSGASYMADDVKTENPSFATGGLIPASVTVTVPAGTVVTPPADATPAAAPDPAKVETAGLADIVKAAVAEATAPLRDELVLVKADLAKVAAMPVAGGPVAMRTASQTQAARDADATTLRAQAAELLVKADERRREDPILSAGYRERAAELLAKADA